MVLLDLLGEFVLAAEVSAQANLEEDEGKFLAAEGGGVRGGVNWHSLGVDDVRGSSRSCRHQVVKVFSWEDTCRYVPGGRHTFFVPHLHFPLRGESLRVYRHVDSAVFV